LEKGQNCGYEVTGMILLQEEFTESGHLRSTPFEQLCTQPKDAATVGNIFGTSVVE
jgi:hypothetical protein